MKNFDLTQLGEVRFSSRQGAQFVPLGAVSPIEAIYNKEVEEKIRGKTKKSVDMVWATLGMADDTPMEISGELSYSTHGNDKSIPDESGHGTVEEINLFKKGRADFNNKENVGTIIERYISFEKVSFHKYPPTIRSWDNIPKLRLTLFLEPDEGALVFFHFRRNGEYVKIDDDREIEYLQPLPTANNDCSGRDRLTYHIPIFPPTAFEPHEKFQYGFRQTGVAQKYSMVVKILIGKRSHSETDTIIRKMYYHLFGRTHELLIWNPYTYQFDIEDKSKLDSAIDKPILFMIHGTLSNTNQAFGELITGGESSWVNRISKSGVYEKIIGFNHPTFGEGPQENSEALLERIPTKFQAPINVLTHSRGGLLAKYISQNLPQFTVNRGALVACANGVGYFTAGWAISKYLSVMKTMIKQNSPILALISGLAQHSAEWFLKQPGCRAMTPGSDVLNNILTKKIPRRLKHHDNFLPIVGDYTYTLVSGHPLWKKAGENALDFAIKFILGREHDWVVGCKSQDKIQPGKFSKEFRQEKGKRYTARHSDYFERNDIQVLLSNFLSKNPKY